MKMERNSSPMDVSIILELSTNDFRVRTKGGKQRDYKKLQQIRYFHIFNIAECWCEIGCTSKGSVIIQSLKYPISRCYNLKTALFGSSTACYTSATCEKVGHMQMPMFLSLRYSIAISFILSTSFSVTEISLWRDSAKCQSLRLYYPVSLTKILKALQVLIFTAFWRNFPRPSLKYSLLTSTYQRYRDALKTSFSRTSWKMRFYVVVFSILTKGRYS